jgi:hypothetical protein
MSDDVNSPEAFGVAAWFLLYALLASTPELSARAEELFDRVLLLLERLQAGEPDEYLASLYKDARRLVDAALQMERKLREEFP